MCLVQIKCWLYNLYAVIITAIAERFLWKLYFLHHICYYYTALQFKGVVFIKVVIILEQSVLLCIV